MKLKIALLLMLAAMLFAGACAAEYIAAQDYTDVPTAMTQDSVLALEANESSSIITLQPNGESIELLDDVYRFVWKDGNRPARYYDEETQREIARLAGGIDIDILHMTEAMRLELSGRPKAPVTAKMTLDVEYYPGQLIIVVLGIPKGDLVYEWYPYRGRVNTTGVIEWDIPVEEWNLLREQADSFHVLTDRIGPGGERLSGRDGKPERYAIFSKDAGDVIKVRNWYSESGTAIDDNFRLLLVDLTDPMRQEVVRIGEHIAADGRILDWFPGLRESEALLMLPETVDPDTLIAYDIIALRAEHYQDTYGDVNAQIVFGTHYLPEKAMVVLAGFPIKDAQQAPYMEWFVLRAEALEHTGSVEIGFKQLNLPRMEQEPMMLVVISEPVDPQ